MNDQQDESGKQQDNEAPIDPDLEYVHCLLKERVTDEEFSAWSRVDWERHKIIIAIGALRRIIRMYESYLFHSAYFVSRVPGDEDLFLRLRHGFIANVQASDMPRQLVQSVLSELPESLPPVSDLVLYDEDIRTRTFDDFRSIESRLLQHVLETNTLIDVGLADPFFLTHDDSLEALAEAHSRHVDPYDRKFREEYPATFSSGKVSRQIEIIELQLRAVIRSRLNDDLDKVPTHIQDRWKDKLDRSSTESRWERAQKNSDLSSLIDYADLRELQDVILNRSIWATFEDIFDNKSMTEWKFDQLARIRNAIRHSRPLDKITQLEGEAAITWFMAMLTDIKEST